MASGDENESLGYAGYMWEPQYSEEELFERLSDTEDGGDIGHARSADLTWCTCSFCASMDRFFFFFFFFFFVFCFMSQSTAMVIAGWPQFFLDKP